VKHNSFPPRSIFLVATLAVLGMMQFACGAPSGLSPVESTVMPTAAGQPSATQPVVLPLPQPTLTSIAPAIPETRRLTLEYPPRMRAGVEGDIVRLTLEVDDLGNITPTAKVEGNILTGETIQIPNLYETHNVTAEARLDLAGMTVQPPDTIYEPLSPGQSATFSWSIHPQEPGVYRGTVWLHLRFVDRLSGEESRIAISAQIVEIEAVDFFGLSVDLARTSGVLGSIIGGFLGFPFLEEILRFVFKKRGK
jgi:hypothetical protein